MSDPVSAFQAGKLLGVSSTTVMRWLNDGRFPNAVVYPGVERDTVRIPLQDIEALKNQPFKKAEGA